MKTLQKEFHSGCVGIALLALSLALPVAAHASFPGGNYTNTALATWTFEDNATWTNSKGHAPITFTNLSSSNLGNNNALVVDSSNPAYLQYNLIEANGTTNLTVDRGSVMFWFAPNWASTNAGGSGPGVWSRLLEVGNYTTNASYGWWSLYLDPAGVNLYFTGQTNNGNQATYLTAPIKWTSNFWHLVALSYSTTNSTLYLDGVVVTNGSSLTYWPGASVRTNGFTIGSDRAYGLTQAHGMFDDLATYNYPISNSLVATTYVFDSAYYYGNPYDRTNVGGGSYALTNTPNFDVISGPGVLVSNGPASTCVTSSSVWITNVVATLLTNSTVNVTFTIAGGSNGLPYDVFANALLGPTNAAADMWAWMGQGYTCNIYTITNQQFFSEYLVLGTPLDSDGDGLTDAYENLVSHTDPHNAFSNGDGIPDGWKVLWGIPTSGSVSGIDPDRDGLTNWQEYLWGTNPQVNDGLAIFVSSPNGLSGIP